MHDEYGSEQRHDEFFEQNKEILLKTTPMETLVEDNEDGNITSDAMTGSSILDDVKNKSLNYQWRNMALMNCIRERKKCWMHGDCAN